jgi:hypothetical protein
LPPKLRGIQVFNQIRLFTLGQRELQEIVVLDVIALEHWQR